MRGFLLFLIACGCSSSQFKGVSSLSDECALTPVIHVLQHPGCVPKVKLLQFELINLQPFNYSQSHRLHVSENAVVMCKSVLALNFSAHIKSLYKFR